MGGLVSSGISGSIDQDGEHGAEIGLTGSVIIANVSNPANFPRIPTDIGEDVVFFVSGVRGSTYRDYEGGMSVFGGDMVISGALTLGPAATQAADGYKEVFVVNSKNTTRFFKIDGDNERVIIGSTNSGQDIDVGTGVIFFVSGVQGSIAEGGGPGGISCFGGDVLVSGSLTLGPSPTQATDGYTDDFIVNSKNTTRFFKIDGDNEQVIVGSTNSGQNVNVGSDTIFFVSGVQGSLAQNGGPGGISCFGGDVWISGTLEIGLRSGQASAGSVEDFIVNGTNEAAIFFVDGENERIVIGSKHQGQAIAIGEDTFLHTSGAIGGRDNHAPGTAGDNVAVFGGDVVVSGSLFAKEKHIATHKGTPGDNAQRYLRFNAAGSDTGPGVNNKFLAPYGGRLLRVTIRATAAAGSTAIAFHKSTNGTANLNTSETEEVTVNVASANTAYTVTFTGTSVYDAGNILGISYNPSSDPGSFDITSVWEFETYLY